MTNKTIDGVSREMLENLLHCGSTSSFITPSMTAQLRAVLAQEAGHVEVPIWMVMAIYQVRYLGDGGAGWSDVDKDAFNLNLHHKDYQTRTVFNSPPAPVSVVQHPFAERVIRKLQRYQECADDGQGADIGRHWFDLLTQLGLLNRVQRSPALWEITQQGEDCLDKVKELNQ